MEPLTVVLIAILIILWLETVNIDYMEPFKIFIFLGLGYEVLRAIGFI